MSIHGTPARTRRYSKGCLVDEGFSIEEVSDHVDDPDSFVWVDFCAPSVALLNELARELGLHELAIEDAVGRHQRPKVDEYDDHLFLACHVVRAVAGTGGLSITEVDAFVHPHFLITVRKDADFDMDPVVQRIDRMRHLAVHGVGYLLYVLLDAIVDGYFDVVQAFDDYYDDVADGLFSGKPLAIEEQRNWFETRRSLVAFHRLVVPMRELINTLGRREYEAIPVALDPYFQDVRDHVLRITEATESLRDLSTTIVETDLSLREYRQNQVMKKVSSWAAIIAVPTLVTGWYGMNVPYPGSGTGAGVLGAAGLTAGLSGLLYWQFRRRDWL